MSPKRLLPGFERSPGAGGGGIIVAAEVLGEQTEGRCVCEECVQSAACGLCALLHSATNLHLTRPRGSGKGWLALLLPPVSREGVCVWCGVVWCGVVWC